MLALTRSIQHICSGRWYLIGVIALVAVTAAGPGQVITLVAECYWQTSPGGPVLHSTTESSLVVRSPLSAPDNPIFLTTGYQRSFRTRDGQAYTYTDTLASGMLVRTYAWDEGEVRLVDGVLTSDGRVVVDGRPLDLANGPGG